MSNSLRPETATQILRRQHRHIEQKLSLLEAEVEICDADFTTIFVELTTHLQAETEVFYPAAEVALRRSLTEQRRHHQRLREAIDAAASPSDLKSFPRRLFDLTEAFKMHSRLEEGALHASLEGVLGEQRLEALGARMAAFQSAMTAALRAEAAST